MDGPTAMTEIRQLGYRSIILKCSHPLQRDHQAGAGRRSLGEAAGHGTTSPNTAGFVR